MKRRSKAQNKPEASQGPVKAREKKSGPHEPCLESQPYLSVVVASRNDDHGGDPLRRTQIFIDSLAAQAQELRLSIELILVDWNPVAGRAGLGKALRPPKSGSRWFTTRVITVPAQIHRGFKYGEQLVFFQMIAKNVGIRRARGKFILATNIDILFSWELMAFLARRQLDPQRTYRADRLDIPGEIPRRQQPGAILEKAKKNILRHHSRLGPAELLPKLSQLLESGASESDSGKPPSSPVPTFTIRKEGNAHLVFCQKKSVSLEHLHTNACGDFTLLSHVGWHAIRGYPEFEAFSFNIDSMGLVAAHYAGFHEASLLPPCVCYHIEHAVGSGWSPEGESKLFARLNTARILNPEWPVLSPLIDRMHESGMNLEYNHEHWGLGLHELPEAPLGFESTTKFQAKTIDYPVNALRSEYDLDRLTLWHERSLARTQIKEEGLGKAQVYWPDSGGRYSENRSSACRFLLNHEQNLHFLMPAFSPAFPLRFDPTNECGLIEIFSIIVSSCRYGGHVCLFDSMSRRGQKLHVTGTARAHPMDRRFLFRRRQSGLLIESLGNDPIIYLPRLPQKITFPALLQVRLRAAAIVEMGA